MLRFLRSLLDRPVLFDCTSGVNRWPWGGFKAADTASTSCSASSPDPCDYFCLTGRDLTGAEGYRRTIYS